jgi:hypothetical protein
MGGRRGCSWSVTPLCMGVAGFGVSRLAVLFGWPASSGLFVALHPGLLVGTTLDTSEAFGAALMVLALLAWFRNDKFMAAGLMAYLCIVKEPYLAVPIGLLIWEFIGDRQSEWRARLKEKVILIGAVLPLVGWWIYIRTVLHEWPVAQAWLVERPVYGYLDTLAKVSRMASLGGNESQIGIVSICLVLSVGLALVVGVVRASRFETPIDAIFILFVGVASVLSWWQLQYPKELLRILATPLLLLPAVFAGYPGGWSPAQRIDDVEPA